MIRYYWELFLDWITRRRIADVTIRSIREIEGGPVRYVLRLHDQYIVITDRNIYAVAFDYAGYVTALRCL